MNPTAEEAQGWVEIAERHIREREERIRRDRSTQLDWIGWSDWQMSLGRAMFLRGDDRGSVREAFREAARGIIRSFAMAYDASSPFFLGGSFSPSAVSHVSAMDGFNAGLISGEPALTQQLALLVPSSYPTKHAPKEVNGYIQGLKQLLLGEQGNARSYIRESLDDFGRRLPKGGYRQNFYTLTLALSGVIEGDERNFNEGLMLQSQFYKSHAQGEGADTPEEYLDDHLIALGRLGLQRGLGVQREIPYLPKALLEE
jgi:hypothetical protein